MSPSCCAFIMRHDAIGEVDHAEHVGRKQVAHRVRRRARRSRRCSRTPALLISTSMPPIFASASSTTRALSASDDDVGLDAVRAGRRRGRLDVRVVAAGEHHLVSGLARVLNERGANALAAAGNQDSSCAHDGDYLPAEAPLAGEKDYLPGDVIPAGELTLAGARTTCRGQLAKRRFVKSFQRTAPVAGSSIASVAS